MDFIGGIILLAVAVAMLLVAAGEMGNREPFSVIGS
jgi:hypothetical protein